jgi:hypothetical protein
MFWTVSIETDSKDAVLGATGPIGWTKEEALRVARWEANQILRNLDEAPGPSPYLMTDPDGFGDGRLEVLTDGNPNHPHVEAVVRIKASRHATQRYGPRLHPALEALHG